VPRRQDVTQKPGMVNRIVIVGGGTAGWMTAVALSAQLPELDIVLIESGEIPTVGVGEATIPAFRDFNTLAQVDEEAFQKATEATIKLGIEFVGWGAAESRYVHPFDKDMFDFEGREIDGDQILLRAVRDGMTIDRADYSLDIAAAYSGRFATRVGKMSGPAYAFHFDAKLYAAHLRALAEARGVTRIEGTVVSAEQHAGNGHIASAVLKDGRSVHGDLFVDCSGFRGLLIEQTLRAGYDDWTQWLPANRAVAIPCKSVETPTLFTRATARRAGWQWRIPLRHRTGNGYVFSDGFVDEAGAVQELLSNLDGDPLADPHILRFTTGRRRRSWIGNCVAIGLSSGFLEPLESTSIHLVHLAIFQLLKYFPGRYFDPHLVDRFNADMNEAFERIRDFIIAHYKVTTRDDTAFWRYCRDMKVPETLEEKLRQYRMRGTVYRGEGDLFTPSSWNAILFGQGAPNEDIHPIAAGIPKDVLMRMMRDAKVRVVAQLARLPTYESYLSELDASWTAPSRIGQKA